MLACTALAMAPALAAAQAAARDLYKGKVREGLYEVTHETDLSGVPGIPRDKQKSTETRQRCYYKEGLERGVEAGKDCEVRSYKAEGPTTNVTMTCKDGSSTAMKLTFASGSFTTETRTSGTDEGKPFTSVFRQHARYLGPCPYKAPPAPQPAPPPKS